MEERTDDVDDVVVGCDVEVGQTVVTSGGDGGCGCHRVREERGRSRECAAGLACLSALSSSSTMAIRAALALAVLSLRPDPYGSARAPALNLFTATVPARRGALLAFSITPVASTSQSHRAFWITRVERQACCRL